MSPRACWYLAFALKVIFTLQCLESLSLLDTMQVFVSIFSWFIDTVPVLFVLQFEFEDMTKPSKQMQTQRVISPGQKVQHLRLLNGKLRSNIRQLQALQREKAKLQNRVGLFCFILRQIYFITGILNVSLPIKVWLLLTAYTHSDITFTFIGFKNSILWFMQLNLIKRSLQQSQAIQSVLLR